MNSVRRPEIAEIVSKRAWTWINRYVDVKLSGAHAAKFVASFFQFSDEVIVHDVCQP
jgi:hypothetical protein